MAAMVTLRDVSAKLKPYRMGWPDRLPVGSPVWVLNFPSLQLRVERFGYVGPDIVNDIASGEPIAGDIAPSGALLPRGRVAESTMVDWHRVIIVRNAASIDRAGRYRTSQLGTE